MKVGLRLGWITVLLLFGCNKPPIEPLYPEVTIEGRNIMACIVNGRPYLFPLEPPGWNLGDVSFGDLTANYGYFYVSGSTQLADVTIYGMESSVSTGTYTNLCCGNGGSTFSFGNGENYIVKPNDPFNYVKFIRLDDAVAAGTFQLKVFSDDGTDSLSILAGRFDIAR